MDAEQMKKLLKLLEQALKCEQVATITNKAEPKAQAVRSKDGGKNPARRSFSL